MIGAALMMALACSRDLSVWLMAVIDISEDSVRRNSNGRREEL